MKELALVPKAQSGWISLLEYTCEYHGILRFEWLWTTTHTGCLAHGMRHLHALQTAASIITSLTIQVHLELRYLDHAMNTHLLFE
jgi:hypothetical protein